MGIIGKYAIKNIWFNKKKSMLIAMMYIVAIAFFVAEVLLLHNYMESNERNLNNTFGAHDGIFFCESLEAVNYVAESRELQNTGIAETKASGLVSLNYSDRALILGHVDESFAELSCIRIAEGELPKTRNEIVLEQSVKNFMFPNSKVGDEIQLYLMEDGMRIRTITLVGIMDNISSIQWNTEENRRPMLNGLVTEDFVSIAPSYYFVNVKFSPKTEDKQRVIDQMLKNPGVTSYVENQRSNYDTLAMLGMGDGDTGITVVMMALLCFTVLVLILVSFIYLRGSEKLVGLLKIAGFSQKSVIAFFLTKLGLLLVPAFVCGMGLGYWVASGIGENENKVLLSETHFIVLCLCGILIVGIAIIVASIGIGKICKCSVIANLRVEEKQSQVESIPEIKTRNPVVLYSLKNFMANGRESIASCIIIFLAIVIMSIGVIVADGIRRDLEAMARPYDIQIMFPELQEEYISIPIDPSVGIEKQDYEVLKQNENISRIFSLKHYPIYELTKEVVDYDGDGSVEAFLEEKNRLGFPKEYNLRQLRMFGVDYDTRELLKPYVIAGEINEEKLLNGEEMIYVLSSDSDSPYQVGDQLMLMNGKYENGEIELFQINTRIGAIIEFNADDVNTQVYRDYLTGLICAEEALPGFGLEINYSIAYMDVKEKDSYKTLASTLNDLKLLYSSEGISVRDNLQQTAIYEQFYNSFITVMAVFVIGLNIFSAISLVVVVAMKITKRKRLFGFLRAVGLTKIQMFQIIFLENGLSVGISFLLSAISSLVIVFVVGGETAYLNVLLLTFCILVVYIFIVAGICALSVYRNYRESIMDCIRYEE